MKEDICLAEQRLSEKINQNEQRLSENINQVEQRVDLVEQRLSEKINQVEQRVDQLSSKFDQLDLRVKRVHILTGSLVEANIRSYLHEEYGDSFVREFVATDLSDMIYLTTPRIHNLANLISGFEGLYQLSEHS